MIIQVTKHEAMVLQSNASTHAGFLSVVLALLSLRFLAAALSGSAEVAAFNKQMSLVANALESLQKCSEKPPLSMGEAYILDQVAIIRLPQMVRELFELAGFAPVIEVPSMAGDWSVRTPEHLYLLHGERSGITFEFTGPGI